MQRIGIFGSAFDPPTRGHLDVLRQASTEFDKILLVPSAAHAFSKKSQPFSIRTSLLEAFCKDLADLPCQIEICLIEADLLSLNSGKPVYTYDLLKELQKNNPNDDLWFIRGPDNATKETWQRFYRYLDIEQQWSIFTAEEKVPVRSSKLRDLLNNLNGKACQQELSNLVTPSVLKLIVEKNLYRTSA
ncbi:adenylyltransferase/cytidyltransferase family protein [Sansalvadorimonas sp. 2012CJ34-2]|uniref:nicotinate-nucleotide adenylyltransferase n=1 Tax=Parendozoicomonas callyspongiae TaxID=2942213 RepID=A0ABT0PAJ0_9GAMM|nr:adenylyltransferase/cytidyltransferase family protein [Sansalvadorimonas sp. 2012CJ34-2]MCL6268380.1 adenylyltransferase/cytidyltransferase family protein [Sansalvadorimonas sp. 2012CJ34-2]